MIVSYLKYIFSKLNYSKSWSFYFGIFLLRLNCALMLIITNSKYSYLSLINLNFLNEAGNVISYMTCVQIYVELILIILVIVGLFMRFALLILIILKLFNIFTFFEEITILEIELTFLNILFYTALLFTGPGKYSIDRLVKD